MRYWLANVLHNSIAHPLMPFLPRVWGEALHDWTLQFWPPLNEDDFVEPDLVHVLPTTTPEWTWEMGRGLVEYRLVGTERQHLGSVWQDGENSWGYSSTSGVRAPGYPTMYEAALALAQLAESLGHSVLTKGHPVVTVDGFRYTVEGGIITWEWLERTRGSKCRSDSVQWVWGRKSGRMSPGDSIEAKDGMIFTMFDMRDA